MKSKDLAAVLRTFADIFDVAGSREARDQITTFAAVFDAAPTSPVSTVVKRLDSLPTVEHSGRPNLGDVARLLSALQGLLGNAGKAGVVTDINLIERLSRDRAPMEIRAFVHLGTEALRAKRSTADRRATPLRDDLVIYYQRILEAALGKEERFKVAYDELSSNTNLGKGELVAIAKQMTGASPRSKPEALKKIWSMHQSILTTKAKSRAGGGRSAA
jgi:hypothetical protein